MEISHNLDENIAYFEELYSDCGDIVSRRFPIGPQYGSWAFIIYVDNMISRNLIDGIMTNIMIKLRMVPPSACQLMDHIYTALVEGGLSTADISESSDFNKINKGILSGDTALFVDGSNMAVIISSKGFSNRGVPTAETEVVVQGSKEAFSEVIRTNTCLIRRRIRDEGLKVKQLVIGRRSQTDVALMYIKDLVRPEVLSQALSRLHKIDIDAILDCGYVEQLIEDAPYSPFPQCQVTERPDKAAAAILEGRVVIIVDNSPFVLIIPATFNLFFQSAEDYYQRFEIMSFLRILRYVSGGITTVLPALYIAITTYHPSMLPMFLMMKMAGARAGVPFPVVLEVLAMDLAFELLKEAGTRLPSAVGSAIGIVGGLIVGQAAVEAGLVSPIVVIVVALTGIAGFSIPHNSLVNGFRLCKYLLIVMAGLLGLFGLWAGLLVICVHLSSLKSFGVPYLFPFVAGEANNFGDLKDSIIRVPLFKMKRRPLFSRQPVRFRREGNNETE